MFKLQQLITFSLLFVIGASARAQVEKSGGAWLVAARSAEGSEIAINKDNILQLGGGTIQFWSRSTYGYRYPMAAPRLRKWCE